MMRTSALIGVVAAVASAHDGICSGGDANCNVDSGAMDDSALLQVQAPASRQAPATTSALDTCLRRMKKMYDTIGDRTNPGGLLVHMVSPDDVKPILARPLKGGYLPTYRDFADCSGNNRHTCSAWTWHRRDLDTFAYNYPGAGFRMSVILDASKAWSLTTFSGPADRDTNDRNACSNNAAAVFSPPWNRYGIDALPQCMYNGANAAGIGPTDVIYQPTFDSGATAAKTECAVDDQVCKAVTSGGCMNHAWMLDQKICSEINNKLFGNMESCFSFKPIDGPPAGAANFPTPGTGGIYWGVYFSGACKPCTQPYVCTMEPAAGLVPPVYNQVSQRFEQAVGADGSSWANLYFDGMLDASTTEAQCNFEQDKSPELINAFHSWYAMTLTRSANTGTVPYQLFGNVQNSIYMQSEINTYVYGDTFAKEYRDQDVLFFESVVSLGIDTRTCVEMLAFLNDPIYDIPGGASGAKERCVALLGADYEKAEQEQIAESRRLVLQLQGRMTAKAGRAIPLVETHYASNFAANLDSFRKALAGEMPFDETYKPLLR